MSNNNTRNDDTIVSSIVNIVISSVIGSCQAPYNNSIEPLEPDIR